MSKEISSEVVRAILAKRKAVESGEPMPVAPPAVPKKAPKARVWAMPEDGEGYTYMKFSEVFGWKPEGLVGDFPVCSFAPTYWDASMQSHIPEEVVYEPPKRSIELLVSAIMQGDKSLITGPTGSGKSSMVHYIAAKLGIPFQRVACSGDMESSALFGMPTITDGTLGYSHGPAGELGLNGGILLVDEWETTPPEVSMAMQYMLEDQGKIFLRDMAGTSAEKTIEPHAWFRVICTGNTLGQGDTSGAHAGTQVQNTASLDRFQTIITHNYLNKEHETKLIKATVPDLTDEHIDMMLKLASLVRTAYDQQNVSLNVSPRTLINWGKKILYWGDELVALRIAYFDKLEAGDKMVVNEVVQKVYAKEIRV